MITGEFRQMLKEEMRARAEEMAAARNEAFMGAFNFWPGPASNYHVINPAAWRVAMAPASAPAPRAEDCCPHCGCADKKDLQLFSSVTKVCAGCGQ